jgi:hypothetical protein
MTRHKLVLILLLFIGTTAIAQKSKDKAVSNIVMLKNGALFVRLKTSELQITGLKKRGKEKEAEEIRIMQEEKNKSIIAAFKANFNFCPVYFFYSNYSIQIKDGNYKGCLMNTDMQIDSSYNSNNYLIGEFDESSTTQLDAFFIKDKNYIQLNRPFPFLVKQNEMLVSTRSYDKIVSILNEKLFSFHKKNKLI